MIDDHSHDNTPNTHDNDVVLEARNITKRFPGVLANDDVNFKLRRGEILALLGENGAGKSTLMNIIYGLYQQTEGEVYLKGKEVRFSNPREAIHSGIGMVHQHFQLVDVMTVAENVVLGEEREQPKMQTVLVSLLSILLFIIFGYQLTYSESILFGIGGNFLGSGFAESARFIYDAVMFLFLGGILPYSLAGWFTNRFDNQQTTNFVFAGLASAVALGLGLIDSAETLALTALGQTIGIGLAAGYLISQKNEDLSLDLIRPETIFSGLAIGVFGFIAGVNGFGNMIEFAIPLLISLVIASGLAFGISYGLLWLYERWTEVSSTLRVVWGATWRVGLIMVALWVGGQAFRISQMGIMTVILQQTPDQQETYTYTERDFIVPEGEELSPLAKGGSIISSELSVRWNTISQNANGYEDEFDNLLATVDEIFSEQETINDQGEGVRTQSVSTTWNGLDPQLRDAVEETPPLVEDMVFTLLAILFGAISIRSWRGTKMFPEKLVSVDLAFIGLISAIYVYAIATEPQNISDDLQLGLAIASAVIFGLVAYLTYQSRIRREDEILPINPIDTTIDAITTNLYDVASVRNTSAAAEEVRELSKQYGLEVNPNAVIEKLPVGLQQRVEIVKALYRRADVLILDEPTAVLTPQEGKELFRIMRDLANEGVSIIFITHKLKEVFEVANRIVVMRGGKVVGSTSPQESTEASLAEMMVGREVLLQVEKDEAKPTKPVLSVEGLTASDDRGAAAVQDVSFEVYGGEVLGIAGVQGNGQSELVEVITGLRRLEDGVIEIEGRDLKPDEDPEAPIWKRLVAGVLDTGLALILAIIISYFIDYLGGDPDAFEVVSLKTLTSLFFVDLVLTLGGWIIASTSFGKSLLGIKIESNSGNQMSLGQFTFDFNLVVRFLLQILMRYSVVGAILSLINARSDDRKLTWYDHIVDTRVVDAIQVTPRRIKDANVAHVPEDRLRYGMVKPFNIAENLILNDYYEAPYAEAPNAMQVAPLAASYGFVFGISFAALGLVWLSIWESTIWTAVLDFFNVPSRYRSVPTEVALTSEEAFYLNEPLIIALLSLLAVAFVLSIVSHFFALFTISKLQSAVIKQDAMQGGLLINADAALNNARQLIKEFDIRTPSATTDGGSLSGGNQQKVVVAREFSRRPRLLIASQPTRGIDVGSIEFIHKQIIAQRDQGAAVLLVSAELDEIMSLSDRIAVMYRGEIIEVLDAKDATREKLGLLMAGIKD